MIQALVGEETLTSSQASLSQSGSTESALSTFENKEEELKRLRDEEVIVNDETDELEEQISDSCHQLRAMQLDLSQMQNKLIALQDRLKAREQKEAKKEDLKRDNEEHVQLKKLAEGKLPALFDKIAELKQVLNQYVHECESKVAQHQGRAQRLAEGATL